MARLLMNVVDRVTQFDSRSIHTSQLHCHPGSVTVLHPILALLSIEVTVLNSPLREISPFAFKNC